MLKKEETIKGAVVEIFQIKKGVAYPAGAPGSDCVVITGEAGSVFDGGTGVRVGGQLEIVEGPKKRGPITTAIVKVQTDKGEVQGHVFWCELRASCRLVKAAPGADSAPPAKPARKSSKALKQFSEKQLQRLPAMGYWIERMGNCVTYICVMNGQCKYIHASHDGDWNTLLWSCCPTAKQIAASKPGEYEHFADHACMLSKYPDVKRGARVKAPNDI